MTAASDVEVTVVCELILHGIGLFQQHFEKDICAIISVCKVPDYEIN